MTERAGWRPDAYGFDGGSGAGASTDGSGRNVVRGRPPKSLVAAFIVVALLLAAFVGWNLSRLGTVPERTVKLDVVADGMYLTWFSAPTISPDGGKLAYVAGNAVWVRDLGEVTGVRVAEVDDRTSVFWSPDGARPQRPTE